MKTVYLLRHSKTEQIIFGKDFERNLTERGIENTKKIAKAFKKHEINIDTVLCSTAYRTKQTLSALSKTFLINQSIINYCDALYLAPFSEYYQQIKTIADNVQSVLIIAHNPGITDFINSLGIVELDNMPTSGLFGFKADCDNWADFDNSNKKFILFEKP
jgi:phosphohistidine phosphatase